MLIYYLVSWFKLKNIFIQKRKNAFLLVVSDFRTPVHGRWQMQANKFFGLSHWFISNLITQIFDYSAVQLEEMPTVTSKHQLTDLPDCFTLPWRLLLQFSSFLITICPQRGIVWKASHSATRSVNCSARLYYWPPLWVETKL